MTTKLRAVQEGRRLRVIEADVRRLAGLPDDGHEAVSSRPDAAQRDAVRPGPVALAATPAATYYCPTCDADRPRAEFRVSRTPVRLAHREGALTVTLLVHRPCRHSAALLRRVRDRAAARRSDPPV